MKIDGVIRPKNGSSSFNFESWCDFVRSRPELVRPEPKIGKNPFTGEPVEFKASQDAAEIVVDGSIVGSASWSMSEEPLVNVTIEESRIALVKEWAEELNGEFHPDG